MRVFIPRSASDSLFELGKCHFHVYNLSSCLYLQGVMHWKKSRCKIYLNTGKFFKAMNKKEHSFSSRKLTTLSTYLVKFPLLQPESVKQHFWSISSLAFCMRMLVCSVCVYMHASEGPWKRKTNECQLWTKT